MGFLDDAFDVGKGFVDRIGETLQDTAWTIGAPAATAFDLARAGFDKDVTVGGSLLTGFQRGTQLFFGDDNDPNNPDDDEENLFSPGIQATMDGLEWVYDNAIAQPVGAALITEQRLLADLKGVEDNASPIDFGSAWAEADEKTGGYGRGTSVGREWAYLWKGFADGKALTNEGQQILDDQSRAFDFASGSADFFSRFFLDPTIVAGKAAKAARIAQVVHRLEPGSDIAALLQKQGGGVLAGFGKRHDAAIDFIVKPTATGKTRTAPEIYAAFGGLRNATDGPAIANLMENTVRSLRKQEVDEDTIKEQVRLISRASMGDGGALKEIDGKVSETKDALAQLYSSRNELEKAAEMAVAPRPRVFVGSSTGDLVEDVAARGEDYFASDEFIRLTDERLKAVSKDIRAAEQEAARHEKLRIFFAGTDDGAKGRVGVLSDQPLLASAVGARTTGLEKRAAREAGTPVGMDFVFQSSLWNHGIKAQVPVVGRLLQPKVLAPHIYFGQKAVRAFKQPAAAREIRLQDERAPITLNDFLKHSEVHPDTRMRLVSELAGAKTESQKQTIVDQAIGLARDSVIDAYRAKNPHLTDEVLQLVKNDLAKDYTWERHRSALTARMFTAHKLVGPDGEAKRGDIRIDSNGQPTYVLDTQIVNTIPLPDMKALEHVLHKHSNWVTDMAAWVKGDRAPDPGRIAEISRRLFDGAVGEKTYRADNLARTITNANMRAWQTEELMKTGLAGLTNMWKFLQLGTRPQAYIMRNLADSDMRAIAKVGPLAFAMHAAPRTVGIATAGGATRVKQHFAAAADDNALTALETDIEKFEDAWRATNDGDIVDEAYDDLLKERDALRARLHLYRTGGREGRRKAYGIFGDPGQKSIKTRAGEITGAFADDYGRMQRWKNASTLAAGIYGDTEKITYSHLTSGNWTYVDTSDPVHHMESWLHAVNAQLRQSKIGAKALELQAKHGDDPEKATAALLKWAKSTPEGRELMGRLQWTWANREQAAREVVGYVNHYLPSRALREKAVKERIKQDDLEAAFPDVELRPPVHGESLSLATERGNHAAKALNNFMSRYMTFISDAPEDQLARHPLYAAVYEQEAKRRAEFLLADPRIEHFTSGSIQKLIQDQAHKKAQDTLKRYMFDVATRSDLAHAMRFVSPFIAAWEDTVRKWGRIASEDPSILGKAYLAWNAPNSLGLVVDKDGKPVDRDNFTDANYMLLRAPSWVPGIGGKSLKVGDSEFRIPKQTVNIVLQGGLQPGFGPLMAIPVGKLQVANPSMEGLAKFVNPYGPPEGVWDAVAPSVFKRAEELINDQSRAHMYDTERIFMAMQHEYREDPLRFGNKPPTWEDAAERARSVGYLKLLNNFSNPFPAIFDSPYKLYVDAYRDLKSRERNEGHERGWADEQFIKGYGESFFPLVQGMSKNNAGLGSSAEAVEASKRYESLISKYGISADGQSNANLIRIIVGQEGEGDFNQSAHRWQESREISPASGETFRSVANSQEAAADADTALGWYKYRQFMNTVDGLANERGLRTYADDEELTATRKEFVENLKAENPAWRVDFESMDPGKFTRDLEALAEIATNPKVSGRDDMRAVREYLALRQALGEQLDELGITPGSQDAIPLKQEFTDAVQDLAGANIRFAEWIYHPFLERDPLLEPLTSVQNAPAASVSWGF